MKNKGLNQQQIDDIQRKIIDIFGLENIETAFITGSIAAGNFRDDSDIDILVCLSSNQNLQEKKINFEKYYFELHQEHKRTPDHISPGEILFYDNLEKAIENLSYIEPQEILKNRDDFDAICWAGMLISKRIQIIPDSEKILKLQEKSRGIVYKWVKDLDPVTLFTENTGKLTDVDKILRNKISCPGYYDAH